MVIATTGTTRLSVDIAELLEVELPKPQAVIENIFYKDTTLMVAGRSKSGKSFLSIAFALSLATKKPFLGRFNVPERRRTLIIAEEDGINRIARRFQEVARGMGIDPKSIKADVVRVIPREGILIDDDESFAVLRAEIREFEPDVVVFDTLSRVHGQNEDKSSEMRIVFRRLDELRREFGCSFILIHHNNKTLGNGRSGIDKIRGSTAIAAYLDAIMSFGKSAGGGRTRIETFNKDGDPFDFILSYQNTGREVILTAEDVLDDDTRADAEDQRTLAVVVDLAKKSPGGVPLKDIYLTLGLTRVPVFERLKKLVDAGSISKTRKKNRDLYLPK